MPRVFNTASCNTCRHRKVKCDQATPICLNCSKAGRYCSRSTRPFQVRLREYQAPRKHSPGIPFADHPRDALQDPIIAHLFRHYIASLAPWYDLSDAASTFGTAVPELCLQEPLLFNAAVALAGIHKSKIGVGFKEIGTFYHERCIRVLIDLRAEDDLISSGAALAATCLLRSYEILDGDEDPNRHLQGAYSMASRLTLFSTGSGLPRDIIAAGFWNYLREDITFSLFERCPLKIDLEPIPPLTEHEADQDYLNSISLILGRVINATFMEEISATQWESALQMLYSWIAARPSRLKPFSTIGATKDDCLPSIWFLQDCHAAATHYQLVTTAVLVATASSTQLENLRSNELFEDIKTETSAGTREDMLEICAVLICAIAFTASSSPVMVNAFGPISYCARFVRKEPMQDEIVRRLLAFRTTIGWPVQRMTRNLNESWSRQGGGEA